MANTLEEFRDSLSLRRPFLTKIEDHFLEKIIDRILFLPTKGVNPKRPTLKKIPVRNVLVQPEMSESETSFGRNLLPLGMSVVRGMRGVGGLCEMCLCLARAV